MFGMMELNLIHTAGQWIGVPAETENTESNTKKEDKKKERRRKYWVDIYFDLFEYCSRITINL